MKKLLVFFALFLFLASPVFATKIADTQMTGLSTKADLPAASIATSDKIPVYDATATAWKTVEAVDLATNAEVGTSTAAELNFNDQSAQTSTVIAGGAVNPAILISRLDASAGGGTITLAAPDATMDGKVKIIEYTGGGTNALTMALTNVQGQSGGTIATFNADNETMVLIGGKNKWTVLKESGVTCA